MVSIGLPQCGVYKPNLARFQHETRCAREFLVSIGLWTPQCGVYRPNLPRFRHETRCAREFVVSIGLWTPQCGVYKPNLVRFEHETRCAREFMVSIGLWTPQTPRTLSHILFNAKISWDLTYRHHRLIEETKSFPKLFADWKSDHY